MKAYYTRVSTTQQNGNRFNLEQQRQNYGHDLVYFDTCSGAMDFAKRPQAKELVKQCQKGKVTSIYCPELSRLGRNTRNVLDTLKSFETMGVEVELGDIGIKSKNPNGTENLCYPLIITILSAVNEMERKIIVERTKEGRQAFIDKGGKLGRPKGTAVSREEFMNTATAKRIKRYLDKGYSIKAIARECECGISKVYKVMEYTGISRSGKRTEKAK